MSEILVVPYVEIDGARTVTDVVIRHVFRKMKLDQTLEVVFYDGTVRQEEDLLQTLKNPGNYVCFVYVDRQLRGLAWFNELRVASYVGYATAHFCVFKESWGEEARKMGEQVLQYWFSFPKSDGTPMLDLIMGVTPSHYRHALKFVSSLGFQTIGKVPGILYHAYLNRRVNAVLSYCERPK